MDVLALLRSKNGCLERFLDTSNDYWENHASKGDLSGIEAFYQSREAILKALDLFDRKLTEALTLAPETDRTPELRENARKILDQWDRLVLAIAAVDAKIIRKVDEAKDAALKELHDGRKSIETVSKFKSTWVRESGEGLDKKL